MDKTIEQWFQKHFGNFTPGTEIHMALEAAKKDLLSVLGITHEPKQEEAAPAPAVVEPAAETPSTSQP